MDSFYPQLEKRSDKGDTPYNLRNCAYMDDFYKPKIIYPNMTKFLPFIFDHEKYLTNQKCFIITGENVEYLTAFLNSSLFKYCFRDNFPELQGGTRELSKTFLDKIPVLQVNQQQNLIFKNLITKIHGFSTTDYQYKEIAIEIDQLIFDLYKLTHEERLIIGYIEIQ